MSNISIYVLILTVTFIFSLLFMYLSYKSGVKFGIIDYPGSRKVHDKPIPRTGGIGIIVGFLVFSAISFTFMPIELNAKVIHYFICLISIFLLGFIDDIINLRARFKLVIQSAIAIYFLFYVHTPDLSKILFFLDGNQLDLVSALLLFFWIIVITNSFNVIDGLDGLASGLGVIACVALTFFALNNLSLISLIFISIFTILLLSFSVLNFHPASLFLGDGGSLLLGFFLATIPIFEVETLVSGNLIFLILIFLIPILDITLALFRRLLKGVSIFLADKSHLHHFLLSKKFDHKQSVKIIHFLAIVLTIAAIISLS